NDIARLPALATELVRLGPSVIAAITGNAPALAAKAATAKIPIVFNTGDDPVRLGLVASLNRPGGNVTGVANLAAELMSKQLETLCAVVPDARIIASLSDSTIVDPDGADREEAATGQLLGRKMVFLRADSEREIDDAFMRLQQLDAEALLIRRTVFLISQVERLGELSL